MTHCVAFFSEKEKIQPLTDRPILNPISSAIVILNSSSELKNQGCKEQAYFDRSGEICK